MILQQLRVDCRPIWVCKAMGTDRTQEFWGCVEGVWLRQRLPEDQLRQLKESYILRPARTPSAFAKVASTVLQSIQSLKDFIRLHQQDYLAEGAYTEADKDKIESEVGLFVKTCTQQVEQLKNSVLAAQGALPAAAGQSKQGGQQGSPARINEQTAAHLHGVVLSLAEQLHAASSRFDRFRAQRYQQMVQKQERLAALTAGVSRLGAPAAPGRPNVPGSHSRHSSVGGLGGKHHSSGADGLVQKGSSSSTAQGPGSQAGVPASSSSKSLGSFLSSASNSRLGASLLGRVKGSASALLQKAVGELSNGGDQGDLQQGTNGDSRQHHSRSTGSLSGSGQQSKLGVEASEGRGSYSSEVAERRQQQQLLLEQENLALAEHLAARGQSVLQVERTVREVATLNQIFSSAVLHQAEAIEAIYADAVQASQNIKLGNRELKKTVKVNQSTQRHILVLLLAATLGLLFLDWFNS